MGGKLREVRKDSAVAVVCKVRVSGDVMMRLISCAIGRA